MAIEARILAPEGRYILAQANGLGTVPPSVHPPDCPETASMFRPSRANFVISQGFALGLYVLPLRGTATH